MLHLALCHMDQRHRLFSSCMQCQLLMICGSSDLMIMQIKFRWVARLVIAVKLLGQTNKKCVFELKISQTHPILAPNLYECVFSQVNICRRLSGCHISGRGFLRQFGPPEHSAPVCSASVLVPGCMYKCELIINAEKIRCISDNHS